MVFTSNGVGVGVIIRSVKRYDVVKIKQRSGKQSSVSNCAYDCVAYNLVKTRLKLWIYEIHIFELRNEEINVKKILAVINATYQCRLSFRNSISCVNNCEDLLYIYENQIVGVVSRSRRKWRRFDWFLLPLLLTTLSFSFIQLPFNWLVQICRITSVWSA